MKARASLAKPPRLNLKQKIIYSGILSATTKSIEKCGKLVFEYNCWTCQKTHLRRAYCKLRYHNDKTCFKARKRRILQRMGISNVLSCRYCGSYNLDYYEDKIVCKDCNAEYTGPKRLSKLKWRRKYSNYRLFFGPTCKFLTITPSDKVFLHQYRKKRREFIKKLRIFLYYLRHPYKLSKTRREELADKGHKRFKKGYNFYSVGVLDQSFLKEGGELKLENGFIYCNLHSHLAISERGSDKYPINRELLIDLWKVLFNEKPHNLWVEQKDTDFVFDYLAKRAAGRLGDCEKNNVHYLSDILSPREYDVYFRNSRIFRAYGIQKKLVCDKCGRVYNQKEDCGFCQKCGGLLQLSLIPYDYNRKNPAKRVLFILRDNNRLNICPHCGSPMIELAGIIEDDAYIYGKPPPNKPKNQDPNNSRLDNQLDQMKKEFKTKKSLNISNLKNHYDPKLIDKLLQKGLLIRSGQKVFLN